MLKVTTMKEILEKKTDEDKIEQILEDFHNFAFYDDTWEDRILLEFKWVIEEWEKVLGNKNLTKYLDTNYFRKLEDLIEEENYDQVRGIARIIDLVSCFFQHYIYAFDDFMRRNHRNSIMRCGLICERFMNRLMLVLDHPELVLSDKKNIKFENQVGKLQNDLQGNFEDIDFFCSTNRYIYGKRSKKSVHDTGVGGEILNKSIISLIPGLYRLYLDILELQGMKISERDDLERIMNDSIETKTTMLLSIEVGKPKAIDEVIRLAYRNGFFKEGKSLSDFMSYCQENRYNFPKTTTYNGLERACKGKEKLLYKRNGRYFERTPPSEFFG
jgi:hypothetical protein